MLHHVRSAAPAHAPNLPGRAASARRAARARTPPGGLQTHAVQRAACGPRSRPRPQPGVSNQPPSRSGGTGAEVSAPGRCAGPPAVLHTLLRKSRNMRSMQRCRRSETRAPRALLLVHPATLPRLRPSARAPLFDPTLAEDAPRGGVCAPVEVRTARTARTHRTYARHSSKMDPAHSSAAGRTCCASCPSEPIGPRAEQAPCWPTPAAPSDGCRVPGARGQGTDV